MHRLERIFGLNLCCKSLSPGEKCYNKGTLVRSDTSVLPSIDRKASSVNKEITGYARNKETIEIQIVKRYAPNYY